MREVLISIKPKWCELIANGKKTVEVRKTKPKLEIPFKVYIYCTLQGSNEFFQSLKNSLGEYEALSKWNRENWGIKKGKVIGEFICDELTGGFWISPFSDYLQRQSCLSYDEVCDYANGKPIFAWHISNLVIYKKPRELSEFYTVDNEAVKQCEHRERVYNNPDFTNGAWLLGSYVCNKDETDWCTKCKTKSITRPPQSWCYVEGGANE